MSTMASNTEVRSYESTRARLAATVEYESRSSEPVDLERKGASPPPIAGMGATTFNASDMLQPNPTVMGNVKGNKHPSNLYFFQL